MTIQEFIDAAHVTITSKKCLDNPHIDEFDMDHWKVVLKIKKRRMQMTTYFSKGTGHGGKEPTANEVLDSLAMEASSVNESMFDEWCSEMGYSEDSRKAEKAYRVCKQASYRLNRLLGGSAYRTLLYETERL